MYWNVFANRKMILTRKIKLTLTSTKELSRSRSSMMVRLVTPLVEGKLFAVLWLKTVVVLEKRLMLMVIKSAALASRLAKILKRFWKKPAPYLTGCMCDKLETIPVYGKEKRLGGSLILLSAW